MKILNLLISNKMRLKLFNKIAAWLYRQLDNLNNNNYITKRFKN